jgi:preprotein translocase subunit YajC
MVGLMVFMILMTVTSGRKQKKQREALMSGLKKHDKVLTNGGVIGTIAEMNDSEVVLKVDESSNTRIRFAKSAVTTIISSGRTDSSDHDS